MKVSDGPRIKRRAGMTIIEVVVAMLLITVVAPGIYHGVVQALAFNNLSSQYFAAAGLGRDWLEQMRGMQYVNIDNTTFGTESVVLNHLGLNQNQPLYATRSAIIQEAHLPTRKNIEISVSWQYRGRTYSETLYSVIYVKNETISKGLRGDVAGTISINPNNSPDNYFLLTLADGSAISRADLHQDKTGFSGLATEVRFRPKGNGTQNGLLLNGESFTIFNNQTYRIEGDDLQVQVFNTHVNPAGKAVGQWKISLTGANARIHTD